MIKGLYVDVWREGLKNQDEADELLSFCREAGVTDLFVHMHRDIVSVAIDWDYLAYILAHRGTIKVHGWFSGLQLGKNNVWTQTEYTNVATITSNGLVYLDPTNAYDFFVSRYRTFLDKYPTIAGIHLDKMRLPDNTQRSVISSLIMEVKNLCEQRHKELSVVVVKDKDVTADWSFDWSTLVAMDTSEADYEAKIARLPAGSVISLGCFMHDLAHSQVRIEKAKARGLKIIYFSYGFCSMWNDDRLEFMQLLSDVDHN